MRTDKIIAEIDAEITRLKQVRDLLSSNESKHSAQRARKDRKLSAAARKRISEAQRKRWAKQKATTKG